MNTADVLCYMLFATILILAVLALVYLSRRRMDWQIALAWILLAVLVPVLGPILVIRMRPGKLSRTTRAPVFQKYNVRL